MPFEEELCQQLMDTDSLSGVTEKEQMVLERSWAKVFASEIFPAIDESRFLTIYGNKDLQPDVPIRVIVGALIIKEFFGYSDAEVVENLILDLHFQFALHTTGFVEQPLSGKDLSRFRKQCYDYERIYNIDLYGSCVNDLNQKIVKMAGVNRRIQCMDSGRIVESIRLFSRMELIYTCIAKFCVYLEKEHPGLLTESLRVYIDPDEFKRVFYYQQEGGLDNVIQKIINDSDALLEVCGCGFENILEYELFIRCMSEQTIVEDGKRCLRTKEDGTINSAKFQDSSKYKVTYCDKVGEFHQVRSADIDESVGVSIYNQGEQNFYNEGQFLQESATETEISEDVVPLVNDGSYGNSKDEEPVSKRDYVLVTTAATEKANPNIFDGFQFSEDGTKLEKCAGGYSPQKCQYRKNARQVVAIFSPEHCRSCSHQGHCNPKIKNGKAKCMISMNATNHAKKEYIIRHEEYGHHTVLQNEYEAKPYKMTFYERNCLLSNLLDVLLEQVKLQQEVRDRWFGHYLTIIGALAALATLCLKIFENNVTKEILYFVLGIMFGFACLLGSLFYILYLCQRKNYRQTYNFLSSIQTELFESVSVIPSKLYENKIFSTKRHGADYYTLLIQSLIDAAMLAVGIVFFSISQNIQTEIVYMNAAIGFVGNFAVLQLIHYFYERRKGKNETKQNV
ncbi:MAG: transposase [bacterium]|nr:transposase [bacterium]